MARARIRHTRPLRRGKVAALSALTVAAILGVVGWLAAPSQSQRLVQAASRANGGEAEVDYHLATWLDPRNTSARLGLARAQIAAGRPDEALSALRRAGEGSEATRLRIRAYLELGRYTAAADTAAQLTRPAASHATSRPEARRREASPTPDADLTLAAAAAILASRPSDAATLTFRLSSPEALQRVKRLQAGKESLATELYALGLLRSSSAILLPLPTSFERNLLLGRIRYAQHTAAALAEASDFLTSALALNPSSLEARRLLGTVYRDQRNVTAAQHQASLIAKLASGRP